MTTLLIWEVHLYSRDLYYALQIKEIHLDAEAIFFVCAY